MLEHTREILENWVGESRENKLRTAQELLVNTLATRAREDLVFNNCESTLNYFWYFYFESND